MNKHVCKRDVQCLGVGFLCSARLNCLRMSCAADLCLGSALLRSQVVGSADKISGKNTVMCRLADFKVSALSVDSAMTSPLGAQLLDMT